MHRNIAIFTLAVSLVLGVVGVARSPQLDWRFAEAMAKYGATTPRFETVFEYTSDAGAAHAAAIRHRAEGFSLIWFDGTRESHADVVIMKTDFELAGGDWQAGLPGTYFTKEALSAATSPRQIILSLGNTIQYGADENRMLATIVSLGGWAAASIGDIRIGGGNRIDAVRKLSLSPFLNRSHLVRAPTLTYQDGSIAIPAYFELGNTYGELVRLDHAGRVRDRIRMTQGHLAIQPMIVPLGPASAVALLRNFDGSGRLIATWTADGGQTWTPAEPLDLPNPSAPVAALRLSTGEILMAFNDSQTDASILALALSGDAGRTWRRIAVVEQGQGDARYPAMARLANDDILLTYSTGSKTRIKAQVFNEAWIAAQ